MKPEKDKKTGKWLIQYRYRDWTGKLRKSMKRGFNTRREAEEWLRNFLLKQQSDFDMRFKDFADLYFKDMEARLMKRFVKCNFCLLTQYRKKGRKKGCETRLVDGK